MSAFTKKLNNRYSSMEIINLYEQDVTVNQIINGALDLIGLNLTNLFRCAGIYDVILDGENFHHPAIMKYLMGQSTKNTTYMVHSR